MRSIIDMKLLKDFSYSPLTTKKGASSGVRFLNEHAIVLNLIKGMDIRKQYNTIKLRFDRMDVYKYANILCSYFTAVSKRCIKEEVDDSILDALICGLLVSFEKFHAENDY